MTDRYADYADLTIDRPAAGVVRITLGPDAREGLASHTEKRPPRFTEPTSE